jgi:hypothetical protein
MLQVFCDGFFTFPKDYRMIWIHEYFKKNQAISMDFG